MDGSSWRRAPAVDRPPGSNRWGSSSPASQESQSATNSYADKSNSWRRKDGPSADSSSKWGQCAEGKLTSPARSLLKDGSISDAAVCWLHRLPLHTADKIHDGRGGDLAPAQLVSAVSTCESFEEMEGALMLLGKHLDIIPISAAITRLTYLTKQERGSRNAAQASNAGVADMLDYLLDRASTHLTLAQGRQIAPMLHAMAILQHTGRPSVVRAFCQRALHCVDSFVPLATANTIWSLGKLDAQGCDTVVHALLEAAPLSRFNNSLLSMTAFGLAKLGLTRCSLHMDRILDAAIKCINDFNMQVSFCGCGSMQSMGPCSPCSPLLCRQR